MTRQEFVARFNKQQEKIFDMYQELENHFYDLKKIHNELEELLDLVDDSNFEFEKEE